MGCCFYYGHDIESLQLTINEEFFNISKRLKINKLSLYIEKTHFMILTRNKYVSKIHLFSEEIEINEIKTTTFLSVYIDNKLKVHISHAISKVSRCIGMITKAQQYFSRDSLLTLYYSFVCPYIT